MEDTCSGTATNGPGESASWGLCDATGMMPEDATGWRVYLGVEASEHSYCEGGRARRHRARRPGALPLRTIATIADPEGAIFQISAMGEAAPEG